MSVMASPSEQKIDIAASVRAAYMVVMDNARLAVDLAWLPFAILIGAEIIAWVVGGGGWFGMMLALPVVQLLLFGYAINTDVRHLTTVVWDQDRSAGRAASMNAASRGRGT